MGEMKNKFVVYTALFGNYDDLIDPKENYEGCDFICFTDQKHLTSDICWDNDDLESEPFILEVSPFYQPNPIPPEEFKKLGISYGEWKKSFNLRINYHKYHVDNFFRIKDIYINTLIKNNKI